jgi:predicted nucleotidyltransferase
MSADLEEIKSLRVLEAFVTGSQAYGTATPNSDIDVVCFVSETTKQQLIEVSGGLPVRFGKLNLILETKVGKFLAWKAALRAVLDANQDNKKQGLPPLTREEAVKIHNEFQIGVDGHEPSGRQRDLFSDDY